MYKANAYLVRIIILNVTLSVVYKGSRTALMSYNSKVTFWTLCDGYFTVGNACLNETGLLFSLSFTGARSLRESCLGLACLDESGASDFSLKATL